MVQGFERREVLQQQKQAIEADSVPLTPVMAPQPSSFARVGEEQRILGQVLDKASGMFDNYLDKKKSEWELQGKMDYMAGKTEQEIRQSGNKYSTQGYMAMKARTAANEWETQALQKIKDVDHTLDPVQFRANLSEQYKQLVEQTAGADKYTKRLLTSIAEDVFPRLVQQQMVSNNAYRQKETFDSYRNMLVSEASKLDAADPNSEATIQELLNPEMSGLPKELHLRAVSEALAVTQEQDNDTMVYALGRGMIGSMEEYEKSAGLPEGLVPAVQAVESGGRRYAKDGSILKGPMTYTGEQAEGEMQVMPATQRDPGYGVAPAKDDSPEEIARVGRDYLAAMYKKYGNIEDTLVAYNWGPGNADKWISEGRNKDALPKETRQYLTKVQGKMGKEATKVSSGLTQTMLQMGFNPSDIRAVQNSMEARAARKQLAFDEQRYTIENSIAETARETGNMELAIDLIKEAQSSGGYTDQWVNAQINSAEKQVAEYKKEAEKFHRVDTAVLTGALSSLPADEQALAYSRIRTKTAAALSAIGMPQDQQEDAINQAVLKVSVETNTVDPVLKAQMQAALLGSLTTEDGRIKPSVEAAYANFVHLYDIGGAALAEKYAGDGKALLYDALEFDSGKESSASALLVAKQAQENKRKYGDELKVSKTVPSKTVSNTIKRFGRSFIERALPSTWTDDVASGMYIQQDRALQLFESNTYLHNLVSTRANKLKQADPSRSDEGIVREAWDTVVGTTELVGTNLLFSGNSKTIREAMGVTDDRDNVVHKAMMSYLEDIGPNHWAGEWSRERMQSFIFRGPRAGIIPDFYAAYDPDSESFLVDIYVPTEMFSGRPDTYTTTGKKLVIPARELGKHYAQKSILK